MRDIGLKVQESSSLYEASLDMFSASFNALSQEFEAECIQYSLDELVVGAVAPLVRSIIIKLSSQSFKSCAILWFRFAVS